MFKAGLTIIIGALVFQTGALAQIYVKNPGNVGIGVANPDFKLQVSGWTAIGDQNAHDPWKSGVLQLARPADQGDEKFYLSFVRANNAITGIGYSRNSNIFGIWVAPPQGTYSTPTIAFTPDGNVGIGTITPSPYYKLDVVGSAKASLIDINSGTEDGGRLIFRSEGHPEWRVRNLNGLGFFPGEGNPTSLWLDNSGSIGIGVQDTEGYKLKVAGEMKATRYWTEAGYDWADYVFDSAYHLPSLQEVKAYISKNHHLPEVPSTEDVKKDGINLSDNHVILLKKVEELTLYAIDQNEKLQLIEKKLNDLMKENAVQKEEIENLKKKKDRQ
jgi:hypothetical protein